MQKYKLKRLDSLKQQYQPETLAVSAVNGGGFNAENDIQLYHALSFHPRDVRDQSNNTSGEQ
jgi:hypothetical protein